MSPADRTFMRNGLEFVITAIEESRDCWEGVGMTGPADQQTDWAHALREIADVMDGKVRKSGRKRGLKLVVDN